MLDHVQVLESVPPTPSVVAVVPQDPADPVVAADLSPAFFVLSMAQRKIPLCAIFVFAPYTILIPRKAQPSPLHDEAITYIRS